MPAQQDPIDRRLHALPEAMRLFAEATADYRRLLEVVAERMCWMVGDGCAVILLSEDQTTLLPRAVHFRDPAVGAVARDLLAAGPVRVDGSTLAARVLATGQDLLLPEVDVAALVDEISPAYLALATRLGLRSLMMLRLEIHGRALGLVAVMRVGAAATPFNENDDAVARNLAGHAALAIANAQLLESLQRELKERKRAEDEAKRFVALIQHSGEFIAMAGLDGRILFVNEGGRRLLGLAPDQDLALLRLTDFHTDDGMKRGPIIREKGRWQGQGQLRHFTTGELIDTQISSFLVRDADGAPFGFATVQHDIRETKRLEAQLRRSQKMEAIGTLASGIAHDFNNILGAIIGNVELARMEIGPGRAGQESLDEIAAAGRRAKALVRQILTFGSQHETTKRVLRLGDVVKEAVGLLRATLSAGVELVTAIADDTPNVLADATQIHQVLVNLCANSWHAMEGRGGRIAISVDATAGADGLSPASATDGPAGRQVRLQVTDNGKGMDAATAERIFDPFFTTKPPGVGTGLGLSVVHGIVKDHGGTIRVVSAPGAGATFQILLPAADAAAVAERPAGERSRLTPGRGQHLLYLDDDEPLVKLTKRLLEKLGYRVSGFTRVDEALEAARANPGQFDLMVTDFNMPGLSGLQVAKLMASIRPDLPVILASGSVTDALRESAARAGVRHVIYKPNTIEEMCEALHQLVSRGVEPGRQQD